MKTNNVSHMNENEQAEREGIGQWEGLETSSMTGTEGV